MIKFLFLEGIQRYVFAIIHQSFTILACTGAVLVFFVNSYKFVFIYIFFDICIGIIQGVVQMKKLKSCRQDRPLDVQ